MNLPGRDSNRFDRRNGSVQTIVIALLFFCLGLVVSVLWLRPSPTAGIITRQNDQLSNNTQSILAHLQSPVEIRFYSLLDRGASVSVKEFSQHVGKTLSSYREFAPDRIKLRYDSTTNATPNDALAEGIKGFDFDKGEGCFLGVTLSCNGQKQVLAQLQPEWEAALEADLSRALLRVTQVNPPAPVPSADPLALAATDEVNKAIPNLASVSLQEGIQTLRAVSVSKYMTAVTEMQSQIRQAEEQLSRAKATGTPSQQESALKTLQDLQVTQTQKLKDIAARSQAMIDALTRLKAGGK
jgi:hypothetical protein